MNKDEDPNLDSLSMLDTRGRRRTIHPADVRGRFRRAKPWVYAALIGLYAALPLIEINGHPSILIDLPRRHFYLFGATFNAQDAWLLFFILTGIGFALIVISSLWGRIWCGWACPQTVFLDGVFRSVERWVLGNHIQRMRLDDAPWTAGKVARKGLLHAIYVGLSFVVTQIFLAYFLSAEELFAAIVNGPEGHESAFTWSVAMTTILYFNFWWFREQLCIVVCPYGRLQSVLEDRDTLIIGYDQNRGEPRGKAKDANAGDCVDCKRCVAVCPTHIDIRNGLQLECIGCAYCIDACDEIMDKLKRPRGLVRYDSLRGLDGEEPRFWRPRVFAYLVAGLVGLGVAALAFSSHEPFAANVLRIRGVPFTVQGETVHNHLRVHVTHKGGEPATYRVSAPEGQPARVVLPQPEIRLDEFKGHDLPAVVSLPRAELKPGTEVTLVVTELESGATKTLTIPVLGPGMAPAPGGAGR